jgi:hypothetical protein
VTAAQADRAVPAASRGAAPLLSNTDPVSHLLSKKPPGRLGLSLVHYYGRLIEHDFSGGADHPQPDSLSRVIFDGRWDCDICRPYNERREGARLRQGLKPHRDNLWLAVVPSAAKDFAVGQLDRGRVPYVALPLTEGETALVTVGRFDDNSEPVPDLGGLVEALMRCRWRQHALAASRGLLPPARVYHYWEAYHKETGRRCWHLHDTEDKARKCARETGIELDDTPKGWYIRGTSTRRSLGRVTVSGQRLLGILHDAGIKTWVEVTPPRGGDDPSSDDQRTLIRFEPLDWDDPRACQFRAEAGWKPPARARDDWTPPPHHFVLRITRRGELIA